MWQMVSVCLSIDMGVVFPLPCPSHTLPYMLNAVLFSFHNYQNELTLMCTHDNHYRFLTVIEVHEMHGQMYPNYCQITILLVVSWPLFIIGLLHDDPTPFHSWQIAYKNFGCILPLAHDDHKSVCVCIHVHVHTHTRTYHMCATRSVYTQTIAPDSSDLIIMCVYNYVYVFVLCVCVCLKVTFAS